jgi:hypothetical protein
MSEYESGNEYSGLEGGEENEYEDYPHEGSEYGMEEGEIDEGEAFEYEGEEQEFEEVEISHQSLNRDDRRHSTHKSRIATNNV